MMNAKKVPLFGSERTNLKGARVIGRTNPHELIEVSIVLKPRTPIQLTENQQRHLSHTEFGTKYGPEPATLEKIKQFALLNDLQALARGDELERRTVTVAGTANAMERAFEVQLHNMEYDNGSYRGRVGSIHILEEFSGLIQGVFGLDDRPVAHPHCRRPLYSKAFGSRAAGISYTPTQLAALYGFPDGDGAGQTIGIIELGGGYRPIDLQEYFATLRLNPLSVTSVSVDHGKNRPSNAQSADSEVMLDIEVAGAIAPAAKVVVYFAPNTSRGFQDALSTAIHDKKHNPSVLSISWGGAESTWTTQSLTAFDQAAQDAAALGVTIVAATGDSGSSDGIDDGENHVDFPASSPHVLAAGGTRLVAANGLIQSETAWNDGPQGGSSGGGYSKEFTRPAWQAAVVTQNFRGIPDVAADASPETGYQIQVDGESIVIGGTSAAAPMWAGLIALMNQTLNTRLGFLNPKLYAIDQSDGFRDITVGNNGAYAARPGWDPVTGLGSPKGLGLLNSLRPMTATTTTANAEKVQTETLALARTPTSA